MTDIFPDTRGAVKDNLPIKEVTINSKESTNKALFIPVERSQAGKEEALEEAFYNGAIAAIWEKEYPLPRFIPTDFPIYYVPNTREALHDLAIHFLNLVRPITIVFVGKDDLKTKELTVSLLNETYRVHSTSRITGNDELLTNILTMPKATEVFCLDVAVDYLLELSSLSKLGIDLVVMTDFGQIENNYHSAVNEFAQTSVELLSNIKQNGKGIIDGDLVVFNGLNYNDIIVSIGFDPVNRIHIECDLNKLLMRESSGVKQYKIPEGYGPKQVAFAIKIANHFQLEEDQIYNFLYR
ncbi:UDP-N-acetylmuramoyl-tripeptide--D-alanyl-D-alanine ligase [Aquibacillus kalidii]|uniref:hypothetical protein n=1 Tax=Aquibacillus kalidii TaxID=2762597 RepID=UPI001C9A261C|nr:hypothetical protein [Aquibacillus kalidii]